MRTDSLRGRLFVSFALLVLLALVMAAGLFVALRRDASDRQTLYRVEASAPAIAIELRGLYDRSAGEQEIGDYLHQAARERHVRILLVDVRDGTVAEDSGDSLRSKRLELPALGPPATVPVSRFVSWRGSAGETRNLTFFTAVYGPTARPFTLGRSPGDPSADLTTVVAVSRQTVTNGWLRLVPGLLWAGLAALALSAVMAVLLARSIARPILALTRASEELAKGNFDQAVPLSGSDEIGRLGIAFNSMAREIGQSYLHSRALIANVSHDLKTPLTSILGFAQALHDGAANEEDEVRELSGIILEEAARIFAAVDDVLYLSQLEAGEVILQKAPVEFVELAARCLRRIEATVAESLITLDAEIDGDLWLLGDAGKIERILDNLLDNARKYTPSGGRIRLTAAGDAGRARVCVFNSGSYIPPEELGRIFERFYRSDRSRGSATGGTGLGLAIVRDLVRLQNGTITAASSRDQGTTFELRLPLAPTRPRVEAVRAFDGAGWQRPRESLAAQAAGRSW